LTRRSAASLDEEADGVEMLEATEPAQWGFFWGALEATEPGQRRFLGALIWKAAFYRCGEGG
jgi:hypothetical protein